MSTRTIHAAIFLAITSMLPVSLPRATAANFLTCPPKSEPAARLLSTIYRETSVERPERDILASFLSHREDFFEPSPWLELLGEPARELEQLGPAAIACLLEGLTDPTPTRLTLKARRIEFTDHIDFEVTNDRECRIVQLYCDAEFVPPLSGAPRPASVRVRRGDICAAMLGIIVNRSYFVPFTIPGGRTYIASSVQSARVARAIVALWGDSSSQGRIADSYVADLAAVLRERQFGAQLRLLRFYPEMGERVCSERAARIATLVTKDYPLPPDAIEHGVVSFAAAAHFGTPVTIDEAVSTASTSERMELKLAVIGPRSLSRRPEIARWLDDISLFEHGQEELVGWGLRLAVRFQPETVSTRLAKALEHSRSRLTWALEFVANSSLSSREKLSILNAYLDCEWTTGATFGLAPDLRPLQGKHLATNAARRVLAMPAIDFTANESTAEIVKRFSQEQRETREAIERELARSGVDGFRPTRALD